jgi:hypothetical protein
MALRLRQICLVAEKLEPALDALTDVLGIEVCYVDPEVAGFGLENSLMPIGDQLLEVVAPVEPGTAGGRYLTRRGGDGGYMVITQTTDDHAARRAHVEQMGVRIAFSFEAHGIENMQLHPADTGGSFFEIDRVTLEGGDAPDGPWPPAGRGLAWRAHRKTERVTGIAAAELQSPDPHKLGERWAAIAQLPLASDAAGNPSIELENATLRFVEASDGRGEGLGGIDLCCADRSAILTAAEKRDARVGDDRVDLVGMRIRLV